MRWRFIPLLGCSIILAVVAIGGGDPFARLAMRLGWSGAALKLSHDPVLSGLALSRMGRHRAAAVKFAEAGDAQAYNHATALALDGDYANSLLSYDKLLVRNPDHADARSNFALLVSVYGGTELSLAFDDLLADEKSGSTIEAPEAQGGARATGDGADSDGTSTDIFAPKVETGSGVRRVPKIFDDVFTKANEDWLTTLLDQPGKFLAARLSAEQKRRRADGSGVPEEEGAW